MSSICSKHAARLRGATSVLALVAGVGAASSALADAAAPAGPNQVEEVVVTATKRPEFSKDVPIALTVFGEKELAQRQARDIAALGTALPNVSFNSSGGQLLIDPVIRGISSNTRNAGLESGLAVYVDGVYTGRPETFNAGLQDARTVEVLRGPQGTLFGKNSIAGAMSLTTQDPTADLSGHATVEYGSENELRTSGTLNVPLAGEKAGVRLTLYRDVDDGYVKNLFNGAHIGNTNDWGGRLKARFELTDNLTLVLSADERKDDRRPYFGETLFGQNPISRANPQPIIAPGPFTLNEDHQPDKETRTLWGLSARLDYRAGGFTLSSITAERGTKRRLDEDNDGSPADSVFIDFLDKQKQFSQEFRLVSPDDGRLKYVAGLYYFLQDSGSRHAGNLGKDFAIPGLIQGGIVKTVLPVAQIQTRSYAAYVDGSYRLTDHLELLAGGRITKEEKKVAFSVTPDQFIAPLFFTIPQQGDSIDATDFSPTVGLRYKPTEDLTGYLRVARGYKSGGLNADFISRAPGAPQPTVASLEFRPEQVTNYEVGFKGDFFDRRLKVDLAAFYMDYLNLQVSQFLGLAGGGVTSNAASATVKGLEGDFTAILGDGFSVGGTFGYNDGRYKHYTNADAAGHSADGKRLPGPQTTASLNASYDFVLPGAPGAFTAFAEYSYRGSGFVTPLNEARLELPARTLVNARLTWAGKALRASVFVNNLFDKLYLESAIDDPFASVPTTLGFFGRPRTAGVSLSASF